MLGIYSDIIEELPNSNKNRINFIVLRRYGGRKIENVPDSVHQNLLKKYAKFNFLSICTDTEDKVKFDWVVNLAHYYKVKYIKINCSSIDWINYTINKCHSNFEIIVEPNPDSFIYTSIDIITKLPRETKIIYDPVQYIIRQSQNPYIKQWPLIKNRVAYIDIRDYKIGIGKSAIGDGDAKLKETIADAGKIPLAIECLDDKSGAVTAFNKIIKLYKGENHA